MREEAERAQAALGEAERELQRLVDARVTVTEVPAGPPATVAEPTGSAVAGFDSAPATALAPDYQRILSVPESEAGEGMRCLQLAVALGFEGGAMGLLAMVPVALTADILVVQVLSTSIASRIAYSYGYDAKDPGEQDFISSFAQVRDAVEEFRDI